MNVENILKVADAIEQHSIPDLGFNMRALLNDADEEVPTHFSEPCQTVACIAGWAHVASGGSESERSHEVIWDTAMGWLGISAPDARKLFVPTELLGSFTKIKPDEAVAVLRHLAKTGEVDWSIAAPSLLATEGTEE